MLIHLEKQTPMDEQRSKYEVLLELKRRDQVIQPAPNTEIVGAAHPPKQKWGEERGRLPWAVRNDI